MIRRPGELVEEVTAYSGTERPAPQRPVLAPPAILMDRGTQSYLGDGELRSLPSFPVTNPAYERRPSMAGIAKKRTNQTD